MSKERGKRKRRIREGVVVRSSFWSEPVRLEKVVEREGFFRVIGSTLHSKTHVDRCFRLEDLDRWEVLDSELDFSGDAQRIFFVMEAIRFRYASLFDPLLAIHTSKVDPLPFQIEAVYGYVLRQPRIRFLIADDPGAGKTIMAGLILKELKLRGLVRRVLIVVPGHLKDQWRREMKERFGESFVLLERGIFSSSYGENPCERYDQIITSLDFAKQEEILASLGGVHYDLVIVDEAHKMAAYRYGEKVKKTQRYRVGEVLSRVSTHLIFLTATPHKGDAENFRLFLDLLLPGFFATNEMVEESLRSRDNPLFIRRLKEDLRDFEGRPIFTRRFPVTIKFRLSEEEKVLYNELSRYVVDQYNSALQSELFEGGVRRRNVTFALMILQRRMASSTYALWRSLERRRAKLEKVLRGEEVGRGGFGGYEDWEEVVDLEEGERWRREEEWESITLAKDARELEREIRVIGRLIGRAKKIIEGEGEVKLGQLREAMEEGWRRVEEMGGNRKILIFTESRDTLEYLVERIGGWGYRVNFIHGGMSMEERVRAEGVFRQEGEVMVATEAAGEGINLQFCHIMINYDIPWNPNWLEQRMGRIHRYGQQKDVYIFNLVVEDTREGMVLSKVLDKLEEIRDKLGSDRVFDVIGEVFEGRNLSQLILEALTNAKSMEEILKELDIRPDEGYLARVREVLEESLATRFIDYTRIKEISERAREYRLIPEYVEEFFRRVFQEMGGRLRQFGGRGGEEGVMGIEFIPHEVRRIGERVEFRNRYGEMLRRYSKVTFDKEVSFRRPEVEFISFGHPLFEAVLEWISANWREEMARGALFRDPSGMLDGYIWFYVGEVRDGKGEVAGRRIVAIYEAFSSSGELESGRVREVNPAILWDLLPSGGEAEVLEDRDRLVFRAVELVERYKGEILEERLREAEVKRKYGLKSLEYLIGRLDEELMDLYERQEGGEKVELPIRNKEEQKRLYEAARKRLREEIERELSLSVSTPELLTVVRVVPARVEMVESEEVERVGMEVAMAYERQCGREPEDVSLENLGFDIRSHGEGGVRYIEVKARSGEGEVALTPNEWFKAKRFRDRYYLYVVVNVATRPVLYIVQNPAENLSPQEKREVVRFIVQRGDWKGKAGEVWRE